MITMIKNLLVGSLACAAFLSACDSSQNPSVQVQSNAADNSAPIVAFAIPDRIRTSQSVNLQATRATVDTSAGPVVMTRNGDQFQGTIRVEPGSTFTFTLSIFEEVGGQSIVYATSTGSSNEPVNRDFEITLSAGNFTYPDDDGDGASNLQEREAGSNHANSFSTPTDPDGEPPRESAPGLLQFATNAYSVAELDGELTISVSRSDGSDGRVSVRYELKSETAIIGRDFNSSSGELIWMDGDMAPKQIPITVRTDDINDGEQTFTAHLFAPTGGVAIGNGFARITLSDSTPPAQRGTIQFVSNSATIDENSGQVLLEVERVNGSDGLVNVDFVTTEGTATASDFTAITDPQTIRWADGEEGSRTIRINITNDSEVETAEAFSVNLSNNLGGAALGLATSSVTIIDTTPIPVAGQITLTPNSYIVTEGNGINVVVERLEGADGEVSVSYTTSTGTASATDFTANDGVLNWTAGDSSSRNIEINASADALLETDEQLSITLQDATGGATIGTATIAVTISDATVVRPGALAFANTTATVNEGESTSVSVSRNSGSNGAISISVISPASTLYTVTPATLSWADGESTDKTITVSAASNDTSDDTQTITVQLSEPNGGATVSVGTLSVTLTDTTVVVPPPTGVVTLATDGEWEVCIAPYNTTGPSAYATQLSANEGRIVSCIKACPDTVILDDEFPGWGWDPAALHSCFTTTVAPGTYANAPIYTPQREVININMDLRNFSRNNSIWSCIKETRQNAEFSYVADTTNTIWYQFLDDGTYFYGSTADGSQPIALLGPHTWSATGRVLELGHINIGYRNTLFYPGNQTLHIHPTTDDRLSCTRQVRVNTARLVN